MHKKGITGKGVKVAVIDNTMNFDFMNDEIKNQNIKNCSLYNNTRFHFHGEAVCANLCGKTIGVAPEVDVLYYGDRMNDKDEDAWGIDRWTESIEAVICETLKDIKQRILYGEKIIAVSRSGPIHYNKNPEIVAKTENLIKELNELDCKVISSTVFGTNFTCCETNFNNDINDMDEYKIATFVGPKYYQNVCVLCGGKSVPEHLSETGYKYENDSCYSWSVPQTAGMYVLTKQVNPKITYEHFVELAKSTAIRNKNGLNILNPVALIKQIEKELKPKKQINKL